MTFPDDNDKLPQISEEVINHFKFLQSTIGNKRVQELVESGNMPGIGRAGIPHSHKSADQTKAAEKARIQQDKEKLLGELLPHLETLRDQAELLCRSGSGDAAVFVNVTLHLFYIEPPALSGEAVYHYMELAGCSLSFEEYFSRRVLSRLVRGVCIEEIVSFKYPDQPC